MRVLSNCLKNDQMLIKNIKKALQIKIFCICIQQESTMNVKM